MLCRTFVIRDNLDSFPKNGDLSLRSPFFLLAVYFYFLSPRQLAVTARATAAKKAIFTSSVA